MSRLHIHLFFAIAIALKPVTFATAMYSIQINSSLTIKIIRALMPMKKNDG